MSSYRKGRQLLSLSFSGAGHLLPYHLGASWSILEHINKQEVQKRVSNKKRRSSDKSSSNTSISQISIRGVAGSSSGAIAAVVFSKMPHRIEEFAERFIKKRGKALETLASMLHEEETHWTAKNDVVGNENQNTKVEVSIDQTLTKATAPSIYIATTRCKDGMPHLFRFSNNQIYSTISSNWNTDVILKTVKASCMIPSSFHPIDLFPSFWDDSLHYLDEEGICIDGTYYVDGGIAAPAPHVPLLKSGSKSIIISPISYAGGSNLDENTYRISPSDDSWRLLPFRNITCRNQFLVKPSIQNVQALRVASGTTNPTELQEWYDRGVADADAIMSKLN